MHLQSQTLLTAVEFQQLLATTFRRLHCAAEGSVEKDERRARQEVDEDDAKPEVDVEVDVHVRHHERREVDLAADDGGVGVDVRRQFQTLDAYLHEARQLRQQRRHVDTDDHLPQPAYTRGYTFI